MDNYTLTASAAQAEAVQTHKMKAADYFRAFALQLGNVAKLSGAAVRIAPAFMLETRRAHLKTGQACVLNVASIMDRCKELGLEGVPDGTYDHDCHKVQWSKVPSPMTVKKGIRDLVAAGLIYRYPANEATGFASKGLISRHDLDYVFRVSRILASTRFLVMDSYEMEK